MYGGVVHRTQVYLDEEEMALLADLSARTGAPRSELIRRAVRAQYRGHPTLDELFAQAEHSGGSVPLAEAARILRSER
jgi:hypothetical protein